MAAADAGRSWTAPGSPLAPFRHPAFRAIWTANLFSSIGAMIQSVGAAWLMTELTRSHLLIALVRSRLGGWLITASHHQRHHDLYGCNFGLYIRHWDRWCGTDRGLAAAR